MTGAVTDVAPGTHRQGAAPELAFDVVLVKDAHSNYNWKGHDDIDEWNATLSHAVVRLQSTADVDFQLA